MSDPALWTIWSDFNKRYPGQTTFTPEKWQQIIPSWIDADFYGALELSHSVTPEQIKKQYGMMAKKWHPDKQKDDASREAATLAFQRINESMQVLRDEKLRVAYDFVKQRTTKVPSRKRTAEECAANFMKQPASTGWATTGKGWTTWSDQQPPKRAKERLQPPSESRQYTAPPGPPPAAPPPKPSGTMPQHVPTPTRQVGPTGRAASTQAKTTAPSPSSKAQQMETRIKATVENDSKGEIESNTSQTLSKGLGEGHMSSSSEANAPLRRLLDAIDEFKKFDPDGSGFLTRAKVRNALPRDVPDVDIDVFFDEADLDGDGIVTLAEYIDYSERKWLEVPQLQSDIEEAESNLKQTKLDLKTHQAEDSRL